LSDKTFDEARRDLHYIQAGLNYMLELFGDELANRNEYKKHSGMDAVYFYLSNKYSWPPAMVRGMSYDDLNFMLAEEMEGWSIPKDAAPLRVPAI